MTTVKVKGIDIQLADGNWYVVPPLSLGALELIQDRLSKGYASALDPEYVKLVGDAAVLALARNYPDMTRDRVVNELVGLENMDEVMRAMMDVSGLLRAERSAATGETIAGQEQSTGPRSSPSSPPTPDGPGSASETS